MALLLWGIHMVQTGVRRAFGAKLRGFLGSALRNRFKAFLAGMGVTAILQSSTATGLMVTGFAAGGLPGNVRELRNRLERGLGLSAGAPHLPAQAIFPEQMLLDQPGERVASLAEARERAPTMSISNALYTQRYMPEPAQSRPSKK